MNKPLSKYERKQIVKLGREAFNDPSYGHLNPFEGVDAAKAEAWREGFMRAGLDTVDRGTTSMVYLSLRGNA